MATKNITITVEENLLKRSDGIVSQGIYPNRSRLIEDAIAAKLKELDEKFIGAQAALLDPSDAEEWFEGEIEQWREEY
jgi:metal-responsive CopG/Arc/MetJ family transcriptional regulator